MTGWVKLWFCAAVAVIAASIADPVLESASNAGWFGPGNFTDHSTWDVAPAVLIGLLFVALHFGLRLCSDLAQARRSPGWMRLTSDALGHDVLRFVPLIFALQLLVLYVMETAEQRVVYGHVLGGALWLGGPIAISVAVHAASSILVALAAAKMLRACSDAAIRLCRMVHALVSPVVGDSQAAFVRLPDFVIGHRSIGALGHVGERAPPVVLA